jgi:hypothetical protein
MRKGELRNRAPDQKWRNNGFANDRLSVMLR